MCSRPEISSPSHGPVPQTYGLLGTRQHGRMWAAVQQPSETSSAAPYHLHCGLTISHPGAWKHCLPQTILVPKWLGIAALDHLEIPWNIMVNHYINGIMLIKSNEHKIASLLNVFVSYVNSRQWQINLWNWKICDFCKIFKNTSDKIQQEVPSKGKVTWLYFASTTEKELQCMMCLFIFWSQYILQLGILQLPLFSMTWNSAWFQCVHK